MGSYVAYRLAKDVHHNVTQPAFRQFFGERSARPLPAQPSASTAPRTMPTWGGLQAMRLGLYVCLPVLATVVYSDPVVMRQIITKLNYIIYPAEGPRPPVGEEIEKFRRGAPKK